MRHPMLARARGRSKPLKRRRLQALDGARGVIIVWGTGFAVPPERWYSIAPRVAAGSRGRRHAPGELPATMHLQVIIAMAPCA